MLVLLTLLATQPAPALGVSEVQETCLVLDLESLSGDEQSARVISQLVADAYTKTENYRVITQRDIQQVVEVEVAKQNLGCGDASCLAEVAGALDARYVVYGTVGKLGEETVVQLNLFDAFRTEAVERHTVRTRHLRQLPAMLDEVIADIERARVQVNTPLFATGVGLIGVGGLGVVVGAAGGLMVDSGLGDPRSDATTKSVGLQAAPWLWAVGIGGVLIAGGGVVMVVLAEDP